MINMNTNRLLRGIPNKDFIENGVLAKDAFQFDENLLRNDNYKECSINWYDEEEALLFLLHKMKDNGKKQFPGGVALIDIKRLKEIICCVYNETTFSYERNAINENKYHGNLLLKREATKREKEQIMNGLALVVGSDIIKNE